MNKKTELFLIIGFGQIGASIKDRLLNYKKLNDNFDICIYDIHKLIIIIIIIYLTKSLLL